MDAEFQERRRDSDLSRREKRWSMNSQRLEEIVAELMKPISDVRRSFDTDLSALLEEYLTEAGLHALEAGEQAAGAAPNFSELALLLQHSASVYGRKVDFLYQHVLTVSDSLHASTAEASGGGPEEPAPAGGGRRARRASVAGGGQFAPLQLTASAAARREPGPPRPPPTLPRSYVELEPRQITDRDVPLLDYDREPIGLLADFQVTWRLQDGLLVDTLESSRPTAAAALRPIPLLELQAALDAAAPPDPPPRCSTPLAHSPPAATPLAHTPTPADTPPPPALDHLTHPRRERKRRSDERTDPVSGVKILVSKELRRKLSKKCEFTVAEEWIRCVVEARKKCVLAARRAADRRAAHDFRGFDCTDSIDIGGFPGWSCAEGSAARASLRLDDSDDDGFFEQSSLGDSDGSRGDDSQLSSLSQTPSLAGAEPAWGSWSAAVAARAAAGSARGLQLEELAARVLRRLGGAARPWRALAGAAETPGDLPGLFLATLFLADAGNVRLLAGAPLSLDSFAVQLVSRDRRRLAAALHHHAAPAPAPAPAPADLPSLPRHPVPDVTLRDHD